VPYPNPNLESHLLSYVCDCLFNIFAAILCIGGRFTIHNMRLCRDVMTALVVASKESGLDVNAVGKLNTWSCFEIRM
jgi:hypothetical protein